MATGSSQTHWLLCGCTHLPRPLPQLTAAAQLQPQVQAQSSGIMEEQHLSPGKCQGPAER